MVILIIIIIKIIIIVIHPRVGNTRLMSSGRQSYLMGLTRSLSTTSILVIVVQPQTADYENTRSSDPSQNCRLRVYSQKRDNFLNKICFLLTLSIREIFFYSVQQSIKFSDSSLSKLFSRGVGQKFWSNSSISQIRYADIKLFYFYSMEQ